MKQLIFSVLVFVRLVTIGEALAESGGPLKVKSLQVISPLGIHNDIYDYLKNNLTDKQPFNKDSLITGDNLTFVQPDCDPFLNEENFLKHSQTKADLYKHFNEYFERCGEKLSSESVKGLMGLLRFSSTDYSFFEHPKVQKIVIELSDKTLIPGVLALKDSVTPRPFVIYRCGVFCAAEETASMKNFLMNFFDQSPFNVLFLANNTGIDYIKMNKKFTFGGNAEGPETLAVGEWVKNQSPFKDLVSSLHMAGASLGGNAAIFTSYYNNIFSSVTAICPVLDLHDSMENLYQDGNLGDLYEEGNGVLVANAAFMATKNQLNDGKASLGEIGELIERNPPGSKAEMKDYLGWLVSESLTRRGVPTTPAEFWQGNSFFKKWPVNLKTPTLIFASEDDHVVDNKVNAGKLKKLNSYAKENLGILNLPYGDHCGFNSVYGMKATSMVLRSFVLHNSPEYTSAQYQKHKLPWLLKRVKMSAHEINLAQTFEFKENSNKIDIHFKVLNKLANLGACYLSGLYSPVAGCVFDKKIQIDYRNLKFLGAKIPMNKVEAEALSREFNAKIQFIAEGAPVTGTSKVIDGIAFRTWN